MCIKKLLLLLAVCSSLAHAGTIDETVSAVTDYRFRGISQSNLEPSLANQVEYTSDDGLWIGNKLNTVSKQEYTNGLGTEADVYAGWTHKWTDDIKTYVGDYEYTYAGATQFNTNEVFAQLRVPYFTFKYYRSTTNEFAVPGTMGTQYASVDNYIPYKDVTLVSHVGYTRSPVTGLSYADWKIGPTVNIEGIDVAVNYYWNTGMSNDFKLANTVNGHQLYRNAVILSVGKSF